MAEHYFVMWPGEDFDTVVSLHSSREIADWEAGKLNATVAKGHFVLPEYQTATRDEMLDVLEMMKSGVARPGRVWKIVIYSRLRELNAREDADHRRHHTLEMQKSVIRYKEALLQVLDAASASDTLDELDDRIAAITIPPVTEEGVSRPLDEWYRARVGQRADKVLQ